MPHWTQTLANFLPFKWTFDFPIEALVGTCRPRRCAAGSACSCSGSAIGALTVDRLGAPCATTRRWGLMRRCGPAAFPAARRDERAAVPRQLLRRGLPVAALGRRRARRARARLLAHDRAERLDGAGAARDRRRPDPARRRDRLRRSSRTWTGSPTRCATGKLDFAADEARRRPAAGLLRELRLWQSRRRALGRGSWSRVGAAAVRRPGRDRGRARVRRRARRSARCSSTASG